MSILSALSARKEPVISFGAPGPRPGALPKRIIRAPRNAPTGALTRSIRKEHDRSRFDDMRRALALSDTVAEALSSEVMAGHAYGLESGALAKAMGVIFDFEPIMPTTDHPLMLVGGDPVMRGRAAMALVQRMQRAGRHVAFYCLRAGQFAAPVATYEGGIDVLNVGSVEACIDAVRARDAGELAVIDASCLDEGSVCSNALCMLSLSLSAEAVYIGDGRAPLPPADRMPGIERLIIAGRCPSAQFGPLLDMAYDQSWAFAGLCTAAGIYHPMTPQMLADRAALSTH